MTALRPRASCACLMILGNVEPTITACLESVISARCFDQIILVQDARTADRTPALLEGFRSRYPRIKILWHDWKNQDYAAARNKGLRDARTKFIYWQDGDEVLLDPSGVRELLQNPGRAAYHIWQVSPTPDGGQISIHQLRLFPNLTGVKWELPVHEQVIFSLRKKGIPEKMTNLRVSHSGYADTGINTEKHIERAAIMARWLKQHPRRDGRRAYLEEQYLSSMRYIQELRGGRIS